MKISISSSKNLVRAFYKVIERFPLAFIFTVVGTYSAIMGSNIAYDQGNISIWIKILLCSHLGLIYSITASTFAETRNKKHLTASIISAVIVLLIALYYFSMPNYLLQEDWYRYLLLALFGHLLVAVAPFYKKGFVNAFWFYNKSLFLRFLMAMLYSVVLYTGLAIALLALEKLFGVGIKGKTYFHLWILIAGIFNTCVFLGGIPINGLLLEKETEYPKGLKIFTNYILIPIVSLYILILMAYEAKIIVQFHLPEGWVANLIIAFAVVGILSLLLIFPIRKEAKNKWIIIYSKTYYWLVIPLVALLFVSIGKRISDYGFTEERVWVAGIGIWLLLVACYFIFSKKENIKLIPVALMIFTLFALLFAPVISIKSQQNRLKKVLLKNNLLDVNGKFIKTNKEINNTDGVQITSILEYLYRMHGTKAIQPFFKSTLSKNNGHGYIYSYTDSLITSVGLTPMDSYSATNANSSIYITRATNTQVLNISNYDYLLKDEYVVTASSENLSTGWKLNDITFSINYKFEAHNSQVQIALNDNLQIQIPLDSLLNTVVMVYNQNATKQMRNNEGTMTIENNKIKVKIIVESLNATLTNMKMDYEYFNMNMVYLIKLKNSTEK